jgi:hypothetical protein
MHRMAAVFNLNNHASYVHWHFFDMSVSNILVIACMFLVFFAAIFIPFPSHGASSTQAEDDSADPPRGAPS